MESLPMLTPLTRTSPAGGIFQHPELPKGFAVRGPAGQVSSEPYRPTLCTEVAAQGLPLPGYTHCRRHRKAHHCRSPPAPDRGREGATSRRRGGSSPLQQKEMESQGLTAPPLTADQLSSKPASPMPCLCASSKQPKSSVPQFTQKYKSNNSIP